MAGEASKYLIRLSLQQDAYKVREYVESNQEKFKEVGYETKRHWTDPEDKSGFHYQSHAEKQLSVLTSSPFMGISKSAPKGHDICADDCYPYLIAIAQIREQDIVVADPDGIWLFYSNGQAKFLGHKGE